MSQSSFQGTADYVATSELSVAVNAAIHLQKPLIVKGEPGTGKTTLAEQIALALNKPLLTWYVKSTTTAQQGLYEYDAVARLRDSQLNDGDISDISHYIKRGKLWEAFDADESVVLLIDEIDKADIEFPNDLLLELGKMEFYVYELQKTVKARQRPIVIITSNNEKELPDAFLRRCLFHFIRFPDKDTMKKIVDVHYPNLDAELVSSAMRLFYEMREQRGIKKKPSTSELIDWLKLIIMDGIDPKNLDAVNLKEALPPHIHALIKNEVDLGMLESIGRGIY
jgi:MoxR-like ATPase